MDKSAHASSPQTGHFTDWDIQPARRTAKILIRRQTVGRWPSIRTLGGNGNIPAKVEWPGGARRLKAVFSFRSRLSLPGGWRPVLRSKLYRSARDARQGRLPLGTVPATVSPLRRRYHHRPRPRKQAHDQSHGLDLGAARNLSSVQPDLYDLARLAGAFGAFQRALPAVGLWEHRRGCFRGAGRASLQGSVALAWSIHSAPMGTTSPAQRVVLADGWSHRGAPFTGTHHRCLGSQPVVVAPKRPARVFLGI